MQESYTENLINNLRQDRNLRGNSKNWANWMSMLTLTSCKFCIEQHGKIVDISILRYQEEVQAHPKCKCVYVPMRTKLVGTATNLGMEGADAYLVHRGYLPNYYVDKKAAQQAGWQSGKQHLSSVLPGKMIGGDVYYNDDNKLPSAPGRIWYEADINYVKGKRNRQRVLYSNDGFIFVTYDHYQTFYEITE